MKRMIVCMLAMASLLSGCATVESGRAFDETRISEIQKGKTTKQEIISMFGAPSGTSMDDQGMDILTYEHSTMNASNSALSYVPVVGVFAHTTRVQSETRTLVIKLKDNIVQTYTFTTGTGGTNAKAL